MKTIHKLAYLFSPFSNVAVISFYRQYDSNLVSQEYMLPFYSNHLYLMSVLFTTISISLKPRVYNTSSNNKDKKHSSIIVSHLFLTARELALGPRNYFL